MKIAVVGAGISGNAAAYFLSQEHDVTLFEKRGRLGGHSATKTITHGGRDIAVDTGFIVYNELNYPNLVKLFEHLGVETEPSNMSFAFSASENGHKGSFEWAGSSLNAVFAQRSNILRPGFWSLLRQILRFNKLARQTSTDQKRHTLGLGDWLAENGFTDRFTNAYLLPMAAAIWSTPAEDILDFPAISFIQFFKNHRLIDKERPQWRTVKGGSQRYVAKLTAGLADIRLNADIRTVERSEGAVTVTLADGTQEKFDQLVMATHSDQALSVLKDADDAEAAILGAVKYKPNQVYLHCDPALMPKRSLTWSAWNYLSDTTSAQSGDVCVSYWMNTLQNIDRDRPVFVTLNPPQPPQQALTFGHYEYDHPQYNLAALEAQDKLASIQGKRNTWFCGAWTGYGFHEDGLRSAVVICKALGIALPWETESTISKADKFAEAAE